MNKLAILAALLLSLGCSTVQPSVAEPTSTATRREPFCELAEQYVSAGRAAANVEFDDVVFESAVESCGFVANTGIGYATYHIDGFDEATGVFMGHMKMLLVFGKRGGEWDLLNEQKLIWLPGPAARNPTSSRLKVGSEI